MIFWCIPAIVVMIFATWFGVLGANASSHYSIDTEWQACLFAPNEATLPIIEDTGLSPDVAADLGLSNTELPMGTFINSLIVVGVTIILMSALGLSAVYRAYDNLHSHLVASTVFSFWCIFLCMTYYTATPPVPIAVDTNATILLFMYWLSKDKFTNLNNGNNDCGKAYNILVAYFAMCVLMTFCLALGTWMSARANYLKRVEDKEIASRNSETVKSWPTLSKYIFINTCLMCVCYFGAFLGRIITSFNTVNCFHDYDVNLDDITQGDGNIIWYPDIFFPFCPAVISIDSVLWAATFYPVTVAVMNGTVSEYRVAAFVCFIYITTTGYPAMVYLMQLFYDLHLEDLDTCNDYFAQPDFAFLYGYPNHGQSVTYCTGTRISTYLAVALFAFYHVELVLCTMAYYHYNQDHVAEERRFAPGHVKKFDETDDGLTNDLDVRGTFSITTKEDVVNGPMHHDSFSA